MVVGVVSARERCVVMGVLVMEVVAEDIVHADVSGDKTGREEEDVEEGDTVEAVDVGVLKEIVNTRRDTVAQQGAPDTSLDDELPTTSAGASGQEAPPQDHDTSAPPPADREPPRKRSLRSRTKTENNAKTPTKK
ncbi:hypothetical protein NDU88_003897 [Pleurodeles waltl]|uniref:Uncharacterized protein n=1 Tax=Pleurodeles waltl TaxID=8319 RepID=A0AAV7PJH5_PLEWA|nr:hypothetical protein NDU88_003897 [Pleurodeles waltl]